MTGKTARMQRELDAWLMAHPGKKALIIDPKGQASAWRWFEPHLQLKEGSMSNPEPVPGTTQLYSFGIRSDVVSLAAIESYHEYLVISVRSTTPEMAKRHIEAIFKGKYKDASLTFWDDLEEWEKEVSQ